MFRMSALAAGIISASLLSTQAHAQAPSSPWSAGAIGILQASPYSGGESGFNFFPVVAYEGEKLVVRGPFVDYYLVGSQRNVPAISLTVSLAPNQLEVDGDPALAGIEDRSNSFMGGVRVVYPVLGGNLNASVQTDLTNEHSGQRAVIGWQTTLFSAPDRSWQIQGGAEVEYLSEDYADFYFGVSEQEAAVSAFNAYQTSSVIQPALTLNGYYRINKNWQIIANLGWQFLDSEIKDSPIVDQSGVANGLIGVTYTF